MTKRIFLAIALGLAFTATIAATSFPDYYPPGGFHGTGLVDDVQLEQRRIVVDDVPYLLADNLIVHSMSAYSVPVTQLRRGLMIGYATSQGGRITRIWLLPADYDRSRGRRR